MDGKTNHMEPEVMTWGIVITIGDIKIVEFDNGQSAANFPH